ncbi:MAG: ATP-binding protein [Alphaproteobacteria bacterium]|nr:ATP-binding protein [Alphaproteobacteria bacterium]
MLSSFKIQNFKSILDLNLDFKFDEGKAPNGYKELDTVVFLEPKRNNRYIPCLSIYGANASGKTNIIKALDTFKAIITSRIDNLYIPNKINTKYVSTLFELSFFIKNKEYTYLVEYNKDTIVLESLKENNDIIFEISLKKQNLIKVSGKGYTEQRLKEILDVECCDTNKNQKITFLNRIATNYSGLNKIISDVYKAIKEDIEIYPINMFPLSFGMEKLAASQDYKAINASFEKITSLLRKLDIDIERMQLDRNTTKLAQPIDLQSQPYSISIKDNILSVDYIYSYHKDIDGNEVKFKFTEESEGTQIIAGLLGIFLSALDRGATLIIDELERSLHPLLLTEVVRLFKDKRYNRKNAQLIFTAHNTDILDADLLRISEIGVVKKNANKGTVLTRVSSFEGIRNVTNFRKQYLNGAFSGIPHPYI